jgi:hypothetical protein
VFVIQHFVGNAYKAIGINLHTPIGTCQGFFKKILKSVESSKDLAQYQIKNKKKILLDIVGGMVV